MISKRRLITGAGALVCIAGAPRARAALPPISLPPISMARHEQAMRQAIEEARRNPVYPFGAVIVQASNSDAFDSGTEDAHHELVSCLMHPEHGERIRMRCTGQRVDVGRRQHRTTP